jgi:chemotaxis methyl-accepting protein methylase
MHAKRARGQGSALFAAATPLAFEDLLPTLAQHIGVAVSAYRRPMLERRVRNRMLSLRVCTYEDYLSVLHERGDEASALLERITIKVSRFYRHARAFDALRARILPDLLARYGGALRVWCAGCARGEEAYTLAMLLEEAGAPPEARVLATDLDPQALLAAETATYGRAALEELPQGLCDAYLRPAARAPGSLVCVDERVRARVAFARHDVMTPVPAGAPFHLVSCRNVLIYLEQGAQERVLSSLSAAVKPGGCLFLGETEWPLPAAEAGLTPLDRQARLFQVRV